MHVHSLPIAVDSLGPGQLFGTALQHTLEAASCHLLSRNAGMSTGHCEEFLHKVQSVGIAPCIIAPHCNDCRWETQRPIGPCSGMPGPRQRCSWQ